MDAKLLDINDVCRMLGTTSRTLRYYEEKGLLSPERTAASGFRKFSISDVQVLGIPSHRYGEEIAAFLIPHEGRSLKPEDVRDFCRGRIAWHKIPRYVAMVDDFPRTGNGKVQKFKLRDMAAELFPNVK